jgi:hypothetical protein
MTEIKIELYQGSALIGPQANESLARELAKSIEIAMQAAFEESSSMGSESRAMDDRDDTVYEFEDNLKSIGFRIE